jgi:hypothetical protein
VALLGYLLFVLNVVLRVLRYAMDEGGKECTHRGARTVSLSLSLSLP